MMVRAPGPSTLCRTPPRARVFPGVGGSTVVTPTTKAAAGHDEPMTRAEVAALTGEPVAAGLDWDRRPPGPAAAPGRTWRPTWGWRRPPG